MNKLSNKTKWMISAIAFILGQCFFILSDQWEMWGYIYSNDYGEKVIYYLNKWIGQSLPYETHLLNLITITWGIGFVAMTIKYMIKNNEA